MSGMSIVGDTGVRTIGTSVLTWSVQHYYYIHMKRTLFTCYQASLSRNPPQTAVLS